MDNTVNKKDFSEYVKVQLSGKTNMFDVAKVQELSGLPKEKILDIMKHYTLYNKRWNTKEKVKDIIN